jgi:hypothetical protein
MVRFACNDNMYTIPFTPLRGPQLTNSDNTPPTRTSALQLYNSNSNNNSPYCESYSPPHNHHHIYVSPHRYLAPHGIVWDVRDAPSAITRAGHAISGRSLYEPACAPLQSFMRIRLMTNSGRQLSWSVKVYASADAGFVKLEDVVLSVHTALRLNITPSDYALLCGKDDPARVVQAYEKRYRRLMSARAYQEEKMAGMKRVDFLMGRTHWIGLEQDKAKGADEWILRLG